MTAAAGREEALAAIVALADRGGDADDVLRRTVDVLGGLYPYAAIAFVEEGALAVGPHIGSPSEEARTVPIEFGDIRVAELRVGGAGDEPAETAFLARVAETVAPYCLVGWDTGGEPWEP